MQEYPKVLLSMIPSIYVLVFGVWFGRIFGNHSFTSLGVIGLVVTSVALVRQFRRPLPYAKTSHILEVIKFKGAGEGDARSADWCGGRLSSAQKRTHEILQAIFVLLIFYVIWAWSGSSDKESIFLISPMFIMLPILALSIAFRWGYQLMNMRLPGVFGSNIVFLLAGIPFYNRCHYVPLLHTAVGDACLAADSVTVVPEIPHQC